VLLGNSNLEVLNLDGNLITDSGVVARVVGKSHEIKSVSLKWNKLKVKGLAGLFETVERSISLLNLDLSRNQIGQGLREAAKLGN
jgi:Leucine-rich repeat (LRR) protein